MKGLLQILESWKNQSESYKSPGDLFLKKATNPVYMFKLGVILRRTFCVTVSSCSKIARQFGSYNLQEDN